MNIQPVTTEAVQVPAPARTKTTQAGPETPGASGQEQASRKERLTQALASEPDVRPEVLSRAQQLATDPDYPGPNLLAKLAARLTREARGAK